MSVLCFGESLGLVFNPPRERLRDCAAAGLSFAGSESNTAIGLERLGCAATWLSAVGVDPFGDRIVRQLRAEGVAVGGVLRSPSRPTAVMLRDRLPGGEPAVHYWRRDSAFSEAALELARAWSWPGTFAVHLSGITPALGAAAGEAVRTLIAGARRHGARIWFDVNYRAKLWAADEAARVLRPIAAAADIVFADADEGRLLAGGRSPGKTAAAILALGAKEVVLKLGPEGAVHFAKNARTEHPGFPVPAEVDPIGAGDGFNAGYLSGVIGGKPVKECLRRGCACGSLVCLSDGDWEGLPTLAELDRLASGHRRSER